MLRFTGVFLLTLAAGLAFAADRVAKPVVVIEKPGRCVEDTALMRRDHMKLLVHQRDRTVREGVREKARSLSGCIDCHASAKTGSVLGAEGFCQSCHAYAGVQLDCFECHAAKPARAALGGAR
ncbi:MAG: Hdr-like menaquinol oxidoreductase cytochrome c subunit [Betaproteobacteria bacterium]|nr:Hdr-like menaquinol oxidoreductase cytochrome c subunit [Betaproteobacteria bacterium]